MALFKCVFHSIFYGKWVKYRVLMGVFFLNFSGGFSLYYGNLYAYCESYYNFCLPSDRTDISPAWILSICLTFLPIGNLLADCIKFKLGLWFSVLCGVVFHGSGFLLGYVSILNSVWATALSYGVLGMFGIGMVEILSFYYTTAWFPDQRATAGSIVGVASSVGSIFYNSITTNFINPNNLRPDLIEGKRAYFTQAEILDRVPKAFLVLGVLTIATQFLGFLLVKSPETNPSERECVFKKCGAENYNTISFFFDVSSSECSFARSSNETLNNEKTVDTKSVINRDGNIDHVEESGRERCGDIRSDFRPKDVLRSVNFYLLWHSLMAVSLGMMLVSNYYKTFGLLWIHDDTFLTIVGDFSAISGTLMRILIGIVLDKFRVKSVLVWTTAITMLFLVSWYFTALLNRWLYFINTNFLIGLTGSAFVLYPMASMKFFGLAYFATNAGLVMLAMSFIDLTSTSFVTLILTDLGWFWLFFIASVFMASSVLTTGVFMHRTQFYK